MSDWPPERVRALQERLDLNRAQFAAALNYGSPPRVSELLKKGARGPTARLLDYVDAYGPLHLTADASGQSHQARPAGESKKRA